MKRRDAASAGLNAGASALGTSSEAVARRRPVRLPSCHCGKDGHALGSINCPVHGRKHAANYKAWAIGTQKRNGFHVRRIVWGLLMARSEKRNGEEIRHANLLVGNRKWR